MKKVLLLGDSIRMSYEPFVKEKLKDVAIVAGPEENCCFAKYTLWWLSYKWLKDIMGVPDIVHWNNGIWDVFRLNEEIGIFTPVDEYIDHIKRIHNELKRTNAQIIWATTTPVKDDYPRCYNEDIHKHNAIVIDYMMKENVPINDLNKIVWQNREEYISDDKLHLSDKGKIVCAEAVADKIKAFI